MGKGTSSTSNVDQDTLAHGQLTAVKNLKLKVHQLAVTTVASFDRELNTLGKLKQRNLVKLIGSH